MSTKVGSRFVVALALVIVATNTATAQWSLLTGPGSEFLGVGYSRIATGDMDDRLAAQGYPRLGRTVFGLDLGGYRILPGRFMIGAEWHGLVQGEQPHGEREVGWGGGYGTIGVGYVKQLSPRVRVYPRLGLGGGGFGLWIIQEPLPSVTFEEVLANPGAYPDTRPVGGRETVLRSDNVVVDYGVGVELLSRATVRGPMIGLRFGYLAMSSDTEWSLSDRGVRGGPDATLSGPYARLIFGTGRMR